MCFVWLWSRIQNFSIYQEVLIKNWHALQKSIKSAVWNLPQDWHKVLFNCCYMSVISHTDMLKKINDFFKTIILAYLSTMWSWCDVVIGLCLSSFKSLLLPYHKLETNESYAQFMKLNRKYMHNSIRPRVHKFSM